MPKKDEKQTIDLNSISPELITLLTNQIKSELMNSMPNNQANEEEKILNKKVKVTSISSGSIGVYLLNGRFVKWEKAGDSIMLKVEELVNMNSVSEIYLEQPLLIIEDKEVIKYLGLKEKYDLIEKIKDVDKFLKLDREEIATILDSLSKDMRADLSIEIIRKINDGSIDSRVLVEFLKRKLNI